MDPAVNMFRGNCYRCRQRWVFGSIDAAAGDYGCFLCAACQDECSDSDGAEGEAADEADGPADGQQPSAVAVPPPKRHRPAGGRGRQKLPRPRFRQDGLHLSFEFVGESGAGADNRRPDAASARRLPRRLVAVVSDPRGERFKNMLGAGLWSGAKVLVAYLERCLPRDSAGACSAAGLRVLELGAGVGLPGVALAQLGAEVLLTDLPALVPLLEQNVVANFDVAENAALCRLEMDRARRPRVAALRWGSSEDWAAIAASEPSAVSGEGWDFIVGSDIGYDVEAIGALLETAGLAFAIARSGEEAGGPGAEQPELSAAVPTSRRPRQSPTRVLFSVCQRPGEFDEFCAAVQSAGWSLEVLEVFDMALLRGDPAASPVAIVEVTPRAAASMAAPTAGSRG
eukprot:TRINITY_DN65443_c0_g1_i1.p1 TRINITY_DN65443_c0_g1~~TRINITY_DN65443_c0_g1_i1.p1  ORF type:complete len:398 (+),score=106.81 TRINITY_DN65443_c0_g1_i1:186-1379(+)